MAWVRARAAAGALCLAAAIAHDGAGQTPRTTPPTASAGSIDTTGMPRIRFAHGTTSGIVDDSLTAGDERAYLVGAQQGQVMMVHAIAWSDLARPEATGAATVRVQRVDGRSLKSPGGTGARWSGRLPVSGDYVLRVRAPGKATAYTLAVQIPRRVVVDPESRSTSFSGILPSRAPVDFLIKAPGGRRLEASVGGSSPGTHLHVYGLDDGVQLASLAKRLNQYAGTTPSTQDYVVSVVPGVEGASYDLTITLR